MERFEHHVDVVDVGDPTERMDVDWLAGHLRQCGEDGWELVSLSLAVELERFGSQPPPRLQAPPSGVVAAVTAAFV